MKKLTAAVAIACLFTLISIGTASAAEGGTARPYKCEGTGTIVFDVTNGTVSFDNTQWCTHLGLSTSEGTGPFSVSGGSFSVTQVAANGDELHTNIVSTASDITSTSFTLTNVTTFDGGTGRFQDATGSSVGVVHATISADNPLVYTTTFTVEGTISY